VDRNRLFESLIIAAQVPVVLFLIAANLQAHRVFRIRRVAAIAAGWSVNLLYLSISALALVISTTGPDRPKPPLFVLLEDCSILLSSLIFLLVATLPGPSHWSWKNVPPLGRVGLLLFVGALLLSGLRFVHSDSAAASLEFMWYMNLFHGVFDSSFHLLALLCLAQFVYLDLTPPELRIYRYGIAAIGTVMFAMIQPLYLV
jgi:hypothetical protein